MAIKIAFIGSGQVTALLSALIIDADKKREGGRQLEVSILGRKGSESLKAIRDGGINVNVTFPSAKPSIKRSITIDSRDFKEITDNSDNLKGQDVVFIATKAYSMDKALIEISNKIREGSNNSILVLAQNGIPFWFKHSTEVGARSSQSRSTTKNLHGLKYDEIVGCVLNLACSVEIDDTGKPNYNSYEAMVLGIPIDRPSGESNSEIRQLRRILNDSGIDTAMDRKDIRKEMLKKLQVNIAVNGICAITGKTIGEVLLDDKLKKIVFAAAEDIDNFSQSLISQPLRDEPSLERRLRHSSNHHTSMEIDFRLGNPIEVEAIYGAVIDIKKESGGRVRPVNTIEQIKKILDKMVFLRDSGERDVQKIRESHEIIGYLDELIRDVSSVYRSPTPPPTPNKSIGSISLARKMVGENFDELKSDSSESDNSLSETSDLSSPSNSPRSPSSLDASKFKKRRVGNFDLKDKKIQYSIVNRKDCYAIAKCEDISGVGGYIDLLDSVDNEILSDGKLVRKKDYRLHNSHVSFVNEGGFNKFKSLCEKSYITLKEEKLSNTEHRER